MSVATGKHVGSSPFKSKVEPGSIDAQCSRLFGPGLQAVQLGRENQICVELADIFGNHVQSAAENDADLQVCLEVTDIWGVDTDFIPVCYWS